MADTTADMKQTFATLASGAQSGQLIIENGVAKKCADACNSYIKDLQALMTRAQGMIHIDSFGNLNSAQALANKFKNLGDDQTADSGSYVDAVNKHIAVVQQMADMFTKAGQAFDQSDAATQAQIKAVTRNID